MLTSVVTCVISLCRGHLPATVSNYVLRAREFLVERADPIVVGAAHAHGLIRVVSRAVRQRLERRELVAIEPPVIAATPERVVGD